MIASPISGRPCPTCHREWGVGLACQFCRQIEGQPSSVALSSSARRFGELLLEYVLLICTLGIGWLIWSRIAWGRGQTPAKQVLHMRVLNVRTGEVANWGQMFVREVIAKWIIGLLSWLTLGIVNFWLIWDKNNQELWDKVASTIVASDPENLLAPLNDHQSVTKQSSS